MYVVFLYMLAPWFCISQNDGTVGGGWSHPKDDMDLPVEKALLAPDWPVLSLNKLKNRVCHFVLLIC